MKAKTVKAIKTLVNLVLKVASAVVTFTKGPSA